MAALRVPGAPPRENNHAEEYRPKKYPIQLPAAGHSAPLVFEREVGEKMECLFIQIFSLQDGSPRRIKNPGPATLGHSGRLAGGASVGRYRQEFRLPPVRDPLLTYFPRLSRLLYFTPNGYIFFISDPAFFFPLKPFVIRNKK